MSYELLTCRFFNVIQLLDKMLSQTSQNTITAINHAVSHYISGQLYFNEKVSTKHPCETILSKIS